MQVTLARRLLTTVHTGIRYTLIEVAARHLKDSEVQHIRQSSIAMSRLSTTFLITLLSVLQVLFIPSVTASKDQPRVKRDSLDSIPPGWKLHHAHTPNDRAITLQIALKQHNFDSLAQTLNEVSDPEHERYGKYLTKEYVTNALKSTFILTSRTEKWRSWFGHTLNP